MRDVIRRRLTYANVMATVAVFLALGGGAYALSGVPDRSGVFHGCVNTKTKVLRVVKTARSCRKAKTVKRGRRRARTPGETAIAWNHRGVTGAAGLQGPRGLQGLQGLRGLQGLQGLQGPGAISFAATFPNGPGQVQLAEVGGITIFGGCGPSGANFSFSTPSSSGLDMSGTRTEGSVISAVNIENAPGEDGNTTTPTDFSVIARNRNVSPKTMRIDVHGIKPAGDCEYRGMIIPSS